MQYKAALDKYRQKYGYLNRPVIIARHVIAEMVVVIPALAEDAHLPQLLQSLAAQDTALLKRTLFLFVINNSTGSADWQKESNEKASALLKCYMQSEIIPLQIAYVDCFTEGNGLPDDEAGVGLARKTGLDTALQLFTHPAPDNMLVCLDADCVVSPNYLESLFSAFLSRKIKAAVIRFEHDLPEEPHDRASIVAYELFLLHYQLGMRYAGSYYSYHTVGSTMALTTEMYIKSEGMNRLKAGEDFYFLQKIAKRTPIATIASAIVHPAARRSMRVPFGTGQRMQSYYTAGAVDYTVHDTRCFVLIKQWHQYFTEHVEEPPEKLIEGARAIEPALAQFLSDRGFLQAWAKIQVNGGDLQRQRITWFDAFRTMMLIHYLRDTVLPDVTTFAGLDEMFFLYGYTPYELLSLPASVAERSELYLHAARNLLWNTAE